MSTVVLNAAIYTRKSTEEGLDMAFNSLDAQYEAAATYIANRTALGWRVSPVRYDDGGYTGGNLERPALQRLLHDIEAGQVQVVVAYKLDRITRSLIDFAQLMAFFEKHQVAFVSVTQEFDSSTPVGRLTLNILSSFAQFEREIISERTRDKIAASRRKGLFTGGIPPYGYRIDPVSHQLVIDLTEAPVVARIYQDYLTTHSVTAIVRALNAEGMPSKRFQASTGRVLGGGPWTKALVRKILASPLYRGDVRYRGQDYPGRHPAVIDPETWQQVHDHLGTQARTPRPTRQTALLKGLIRCGTCNCAMTPSSCTARHTVYRYYLCSHSHRHGTRSCPTRVIPAGDIEIVVLAKIEALISHPEALFTEFSALTSPEERHAVFALCTALHQWHGTWSTLSPATRREALHRLIGSITVLPDALTLTFADSSLSLTLARTCARDPHGAPYARPTPLQCAVARAIIWRRMLDDGIYPDIAALATVQACHPSYVARVLNLALLAPDLVDAILQGHMATTLTLQLIPKVFPCLGRSNGHSSRRICRETQREDLLPQILR
ncbi:MAG TPA: recombinase family protein [Armatimonadota bacterium]|nr:recombinase family protein [Armatimonadota bacterium]